MQHVLAMRVEAAEPVEGILDAKRRAPPRVPRPQATMAEAAKLQARVIFALLLREMRTRYGDSRLGYLWALVELVIHIGVLAVVFQFTMHGTPPIGKSFFFFYFTGVLPYLLFTHTAGQVGYAIIQNKPLLQLPPVSNVDVMLARGMLEFVTESVVAFIFICGFLAFGVDAAPRDIGQAAAALLTVWLFGMGVGVINAVINVFDHVWNHLFQIVIRLLYFASGIFYVPAAMPVWVRDILVWNPLLHCVDWFRTSFFAEYQPNWLDRSYPLLAALAALLIGFGLETVFRRKISRTT